MTSTRPTARTSLLIGAAVAFTVLARPTSAEEPATALCFVDVRHDLIPLGIHARNAAGDAQADDTEPIQAAIDHVAQAGGGVVIVPAGAYGIEGLTVVDGVELVGVGPDKTVLRCTDAKPYALITLKGGGLHELTVYGTPSDAESGDNWKVGTGGKGIGSSAKPVHLIHVSEAYNGARINNVHVLESRYDCLYVRGSTGLRVTNCLFDRAGRNVVSMVGNDDNFLFARCHFGSLWGLYHFDIEPAGGRCVRDGAFVDCTFDGRQAGEMGTGTWGSFLCFCGHEELKSRNITLLGCEFHDIYVRVRGVFPQVKFLYSLFDERGRTFIKVRTNPVGEFRDAVVRGNRFLAGGIPARHINYEVAFTGQSIFEGNQPDKFNGAFTAEGSQERAWEEDHPAGVYDAKKDAYAREVTAAEDGTTTVQMPLFGHEFRFSDAEILKPSAARGVSTASKDSGDIALHLDPIMALGDAAIRRLGKGRLEDFADVPDDQYEKAAYGASRGSVYAIRTKDGRFVLLEILELHREEIRFRYRFLPQRQD